MKVFRMKQCLNYGGDDRLAHNKNNDDNNNSIFYQIL